MSQHVRLWATLVALVLGVAQGWLCQQLRMRPIFKDLAAAIVGWVVGGLSAVFVGVLLTVRAADEQGSAGLGSVSFGLTEAVIFGIPAMIVLALLGRLGLHHVGATSMATQPPIVLGAVAAVLGALSATAGVVSAGLP